MRCIDTGTQHDSNGPMTGNFPSIQKILILRGGALGDFILTLPAFAALRRRYPQAAIELCTRPRHAWLALESGLADSAADIDAAEMAELFMPAPQSNQPWPPIYEKYLSNFSLIVNYLPDPDGTLTDNLRRGTQKPCITLPHRPAIGEHAADAWSRPLQSMHDGDVQSAIPRLQLPERLLRPGAAMLRALCGNRAPIVIHPGSGSAIKNWPAENFIQLADSLQHAGDWQPVFLLGEAEADWAKHWQMPWLVIAQPDLAQAAGILTAARLYIGNDSGISHLAASLGIPVVVLFGPSDPVGWGPRGKNVRILRAPGPDYAMAGLSVKTVLQCCEGMLMWRGEPRMDTDEH